MTATTHSEPTADPRGEGELREGAAAFLAQVLGLSDGTDALSGDLSPIKRDVNAAVYTIQLDSTVGPAAFLVYAYALHDRGGEGHTGKELFDAGLETLQRAADRASPGPRAVAHAETGEYGFILATTPGTYRALTGSPTPAGEAQPEPPPVADAAAAREDAAERLLATLQVANAEAAEWLAAVGVSLGHGDDPDGDDALAFGDRETELALFLLDNASIGTLLQALNLIVSTAQATARATARQQAMTSAEDPDGRF